MRSLRRLSNRASCRRRRRGWRRRPRGKSGEPNIERICKLSFNRSNGREIRTQIYMMKKENGRRRSRSSKNLLLLDLSQSCSEESSSM